jgi:hypothetical protein
MSASEGRSVHGERRLRGLRAYYYVLPGALDELAGWRHC